MKVRVDCSFEQYGLPVIWESTGFSPASLLLREDMKEQLSVISDIPSKGRWYVRVHYLLDLLNISDAEKGGPKYDWSYLDEAIETIVGNGFLPIFELMGNPSKRFNDFGLDSQIKAWKHLVYDIAVHYIAVYGLDEIRDWYFESWNEPDGWWQQDLASFLNYFDACSEGLFAADPELRFGGPGTMTTLSSHFTELLAHCDSGLNYLTEQRGVRIDFISTHEKGVKESEHDLTPDTADIVRRERKTFSYVRLHHPRLSELPFMNNECDPQVGWWDFHEWRATPYYAALQVKIICQHLSLPFEAPKINYQLLSGDNGFVGGWGNRTVCSRFGDFEDSKAQAEYSFSESELDRDRNKRPFALVKKPILNAMGMMGLLGDNLLHASVDEPSDTFGVIATRTSDEVVAILLYSSADEIEANEELPFELAVSNIPFENPILVEYRIEQGSTDPYRLWKSLGSPKQLDVSTLQSLRNAAELSRTSGPTVVQSLDGQFSTRSTMPMPSVRLVILSNQQGVCEQVSGLTGRVYPGVVDGFEEVRLQWNAVDSTGLLTYEISFFANGGEEVTRLNSADIIDSGWIHLREQNTEGAYKVRAINYSFEAGTYSEPFVI